MKSTFAVAVLAAVAVAAPGNTHRKTVPDGKIGNDRPFLNFQSQFNKHYHDEIEYTERSERYHSAMQMINENNRRTAESGRSDGLVLAMNFTGDLSEGELQAMMGFKEEDPSMRSELFRGRGNNNRNNDRNNRNNDRSNRNNNRLDGRGRGLVDTAETVDHAADGFMGPVKNQGGCGSCVQFAVSSAVEGVLAIQSGRGSTEHFSEQHMMDCTYGSDYNEANMKANLIARNRELFGKLYGGYGCGGSWMKNTYDFLREHGAVDVSKATYTASESLCTHNASDIVAKASNYGKVVNDIEGMKNAVQRGPVTVAINASSSAFQYYSSGVIKPDECTNSLNHAVVVVGYQDAGDDNGPDPEPPTPEPVADCTVTKWWHTCPETPSRRLQGDNGETNYWKVQNSWGQGWGDQGFVLMQIAEGAGTCGINGYVEWVDMDYVN